MRSGATRRWKATSISSARVKQRTRLAMIPGALLVVAVGITMNERFGALFTEFKQFFDKTQNYRKRRLTYGFV